MEEWTYRRGLMSVWRSAPATLALGWLLPLATLIAGYVVVALLMPQDAVDAPYAPHASLVSYALLLILTLRRPLSAVSLMQPLRRPGMLVLAFAGAMALTWLLEVVWLAEMHDEVQAEMADAFARAPLRFGFVLWVAAPLAEELFFRGWLWERLRTRWPEPAVAIATCALFAWAHGEIALGILPGALALTAARLWCGGLRASVLLHVALNLLAAVSLLWE